MLKKIDALLMDKFPHIILGFTAFWLSLIAFGLYNS